MNENLVVPNVVHESDMARMERSNKRLTIALAIVSVVAVLVIALCVILIYRSNMRWVEAWSSYDYETEEVIVDSDNNGIARYSGNGSVYFEGGGYYGESDSTPHENDGAEQ